MTAHVLFNPAARGGRNRALEPALLRALGAAGIDAELWPTGGPGDAERQARTLGEAGETVLVAGGDGTVHEAVNGLHGTDGVLGVLPLGTGNDFAAALGMAPDLDQAACQLAAAAVRPVDLGRLRWSGRGGRIQERVFANCLGAGFDAVAAARAAETKWLGGRAAYLAAVLRTLWAWRRPHLRVRLTSGALVAANDAERLDDDPATDALDFDGPLFLCEVGNGHSVGGGFLLTPEAVVDDGLLDVCLVRHVTPRRALRLLPLTFSGAHVSAPEVTMARVARLGVTVEQGGGIALQADGETLTFDASEVEIEAAPGALRAIVPGREA